MLAQTFGRLRDESQGRRGVRFERTYDYTPGELWAALTDPEQIRGWLGIAEIDLRPGGAVEIRMGDDPNDEDHTVRGVIRELEPGRALEYEWTFPGETESVVRFDLEPCGDGTLLVLDHRRLGADAATGYGAGWHAHLDALELMLAGRSQSWDDRFQELRPAYAKSAEELPGDPRLGELRVEDDRRGVRFVRQLPAPPEDVWRALTDPDRLRIWMDAEAAEVEPHAGGRVRLFSTEFGEMLGSIRVWEPPHTLEISWDEERGHGVVRYELEPADAGTQLVLDHRMLPTDVVVSIGTGWHTHLEWLDALLADREFDFWPRYRELTPLYGDLAAAAG